MELLDIVGCSSRTDESALRTACYLEGRLTDVHRILYDMNVNLSHIVIIINTRALDLNTSYE